MRTRQNAVSILLMITVWAGVMGSDTEQLRGRYAEARSLLSQLSSDTTAMGDNAARQDSLVEQYVGILAANKRTLLGVDKPAGPEAAAVAESLWTAISELSHLFEHALYGSLGERNRLRVLINSPALGPENLEKFRQFGDTLIADCLWPAIVAEQVDFSRSVFLIGRLNERLCGLPPTHRNRATDRYFGALRNHAMRVIARMELLKGICSCPDSTTRARLPSVLTELKAEQAKTKSVQESYLVNSLEKCINREERQ